MVKDRHLPQKISSGLQFTAYIESWCQHFAEGLILGNRAFTINEGLYFTNVWLAIGSTCGIGIGFHDLADYQGMAAQVENMHDFAFQVYRTLFYQRGVFQFAIKDCKAAY
jgi:fermentation-respiration switch protein FrsA (DUF1100 family)